MKTKKTTKQIKGIVLCLSLTIQCMIYAQPANTVVKKPGIAVADFDCRDYPIDASQTQQYIINELIRVGQFEVMDKYEIEYIRQKDSLIPKGCFSRECLTIYGKKLNIEKMFTGNITLVGESIDITLRILDVASGNFEKITVKEFINIKGSEYPMIRIAINEMFGLPNDAETVKKLTDKAIFDNTVNNPFQLRLRSDGPRMGYVFFSGTNAKIITNKRIEGGFAGYAPAMFQFGYQFEKQYLNEGNFQALLEFLPTITGFDQGRFIPSFTLLNGLRNNKSGWEFAIGPTFSFSRIAKGYYDSDHNWHLASDAAAGSTPDYVTRSDSRGDVTLTTGLLIGAGKTFKSGKMNIPLNVFFVPSTNGSRFGISFGWNGKDRYQNSQK